jgi:phosphoenolpyruvate carboxykinase (GTP)
LRTTGRTGCHSDDGDFLWPGFGENIRVLEWIIDRVEHRADAKETPIGFLPHIEDLNTRNLDISPEALEELTSIDTEEWRADSRVPRRLW